MGWVEIGEGGGEERDGSQVKRESDRDGEERTEREGRERGRGRK